MRGLLGLGGLAPPVVRYERFDPAFSPFLTDFMLPLSPRSDQFLDLDLFKVTAARMRAFSALSFIFSPSWKSMARLVFPSRLELKRPAGSCKAAPLAKVIFTTFL
jgi:hypothetical protein